MVSISSKFVESIEAAVASNDIATLDRMAALYFEAAPHGAQPFSAAIRPTIEGRAAITGSKPGSIIALAEDEGFWGDIGLAAANLVERGRREIWYNERLFVNPNAIRIVAEGDSWFQYPVLLKDIIRDVVDNVPDDQRAPFAVKSLCAAGDTVADMLRQGEFMDAIRLVRPAVFLFSGGGNDLVGDGRFGTLLKRYTAGAGARDLVDAGTFREILAGVIKGYQEIIAAVADSFPGLKMLSHSYDHPQNIVEGPWLKPFLDNNGISLDLGRQIIANMLDDFAAELDRLATIHPNFVHVSVKGTIGSDQKEWHDALHPENAGFLRAARKFIAKINVLTTAMPQQAIGPPPRRFQMLESFTPMQNQPAPTACVQIEAAFANPGYGFPAEQDFGPESSWRSFDDPLVVGQIRDVISLLQHRTDAEDPERIRNRLVTRPLASVRAGPVGATSPVEMAEALIGSDDIEDIQMLLVGYRAAKAVGLVARTSTFSARMPPYGTGFLVGPGLLLTNNHVIQTEDEAVHCVLIMDDERTLVGERIIGRRFRITRDIFVTDLKLDYSLVSVERASTDGGLLEGYDHLELSAASGKALKGETVTVVQHPSGGPKAISIRNSYAMGRRGEGFYYTADTQHGSSGSCVLNRDWQVVALHHRAVPHPRIADDFIANRGVRISSILEHVASLRDGGNAKAAQAMALMGPDAEPARPGPDVAPQAAGAQGGGAAETNGTAANRPAFRPNNVTPANRPTEDDNSLSAPDGNDRSTMSRMAGQVRPLRSFTEASQARRLDAADVRWVQTYSNNPDYWHLPANAEGAAFSLTPALIETAISAGRYSPYTTPEGLVIVAIRGCAIASGDEVILGATSVDFIEQKPDHRTFRCVVSVFDRSQGRLSVFMASTVPNRGGIAGQYNKFHGLSPDAENANMLPTGCYELCVGTHNGSHVVPNVLRLGTGSSSDDALYVTTLRTLNDGVFGLADVWDPCNPMDNIHPAYSASSAAFSSLGCITIPGRCDGGVHTGNWAKFQKAGGFSAPAKRGDRYNLVLTTGMELAALALGGAAAGKSLVRLSHGSTGPEVVSLKSALGLPTTGSFDADTKFALTEREHTLQADRATGIYSVRLERELQLHILPV